MSEQVETGTIECLGQPVAGDGHPHAVGDALAQRAGGYFHSRSPYVLGVARTAAAHLAKNLQIRSEEHTSELQSLMRISYAVICLKQIIQHTIHTTVNN